MFQPHSFHVFRAAWIAVRTIEITLPLCACRSLSVFVKIVGKIARVFEIILSVYAIHSIKSIRCKRYSSLLVSWAPKIKFSRKGIWQLVAERNIVVIKCAKESIVRMNVIVWDPKIIVFTLIVYVSILN